MSLSNIKIGVKMVSRNGKSVMKILKLPILRPLKFKCEIVWQVESLKNYEDLHEKRLLDDKAFFHTNPLYFSNRHKISLLIIHCLKICNLILISSRPLPSYFWQPFCTSNCFFMINKVT